MDINSVGGSAFSESVQTQYAIKCLLLERNAQTAVLDTILDSVELSQEAMDLYASEQQR